MTARPNRSAGYHSTVVLPDAVMVVANSYWQARKALDRVQIDYEPGRLAELNSAKVSQQLRAGLREPGTPARQDGDAAAALHCGRIDAGGHLRSAVSGARLHGADELYGPGPTTGCELWCSTQIASGGTEGRREGLSGLRPTVSTCMSMYLGGGFGRRGEADLRRRRRRPPRPPDGPVKLIWSREEDIQHDFYRPAAAIRFRGGLDGSGKLIALECKVVDGLDARVWPPGGRPSYRSRVPMRTIRFRISASPDSIKDLGVRFGFWRSVNDSHNPFMIEGFIDELARTAEAGSLPVPPRDAAARTGAPVASSRVLDLLAEKADWQHPPAGHVSGYRGASAPSAAISGPSSKSRCRTSTSRCIG